MSLSVRCEIEVYIKIHVGSHLLYIGVFYIIDSLKIKEYH